LGVDSEHPFGDSGHRLYRWHESQSPIDREAANGMFVGTGAFVIGRTTFDVGIDYWGEDGAFGKPCFVLTRRPEQPVRRGPTSFTFVTDGLQAALAQAEDAAGDDAVVIMGGPTTAQQAIASGVVDELRLHVRPILLGAGVRLLDGLPASSGELGTMRMETSSWATHLTFDLSGQTDA
jgi:dihydrofolate reductase